jgi:hypothetical protein
VDREHFVGVCDHQLRRQAPAEKAAVRRQSQAGANTIQRTGDQGEAGGVDRSACGDHAGMVTPPGISGGRSPCQECVLSCFAQRARDNQQVLDPLPSIG